MNGQMPFIGKHGLLQCIQAQRAAAGADQKKTKKAFRGARHKIAVGEFLAAGRGGEEYYHALIDYRNENEKIVRMAMTRKKAWILNKRLTGTGLAFALCGK